MLNLKSLLQKELLIALGCTEPIAVALCCAKAKEIIKDDNFVSLKLHLSSSVIKNANSVCVPNAKGRKGILISAALGTLSMRADKKLRVLDCVTDEQIALADKWIEEGRIEVVHAHDVDILYIKCEMQGEKSSSVCLIEKEHENICYLEKNGEVILDDRKQNFTEAKADETLSVDEILSYARNIDFEKNKSLRKLLLCQAETNSNIANEGLKGSWGEEVGKTLFASALNDIEKEAIANAAAGSDARMAGCSAPVVINAGSGNQGIVCSVPVSYMAKKLNKSEDDMLRALTISNLIALYQKQFIGKLSAFCGAISASAGAACGVAYLKGLSDEQIKMTIINTLACSGGIICDGAKASCAMKIAMGLQSSFMGLHMAEKGLCFKQNDGIVGKDVDETIKSIGRIASDGMSYTNDVILDIMVRGKND